MGDRKPKKTSSGNSDKHKAKQNKTEAERQAAKPDDKGKDKRKK